jgi:hypothetical protein
MVWQVGHTGKGWCTKDMSQALHYLGMGPLYVYEDKTGQPVIQLHTPTNQFKDINDEEINDYTPDMMEIFKQLSEKDDGILLWAHYRRVPGFEDINDKDYATKSPEGAYGYLTAERGKAITPEISKKLQENLHLAGYYIIHASTDGGYSTKRSYSDMLEPERDQYSWRQSQFSQTPKLLGFPDEKTFAAKVISSGDATLASRISAAFSKEIQEMFLKLAKDKKNPVAMVEISTNGLDKRLDRSDEITIMRAQDDETWRKYSQHFHIKISEVDVAKDIQEKLDDKDIEAYLGIMPHDEIEKIFKKSTEKVGDIVLNYLHKHKEVFDKLITTKPDWAFCFAIDVLDHL